MKKSTKGILIGFVSLGVISSIISPNEKVESIDLSIPDYQAEYDINTTIPVDISVLPENANINSLEYISDSDTITFSDSEIVTGIEEGTYNVYVISGDIQSDIIQINVVDITAREEARLEEEQLAKKIEEQESLEELMPQEAEEFESSKTLVSEETEVPENAEPQNTPELNVSESAETNTLESEYPQSASSEQALQESASNVSPSVSPDNNGNFNTYDNESQQQTEDTYVLNTSRMKIHHPSCSSVKKIAPQNYATSSSTLDELINQGYSTCGNCF